MTPLKVIDIGIAPYCEAYTAQRAILAGKKCGDACDYVVFVEHPNVFTIGRKGSTDNILAGRDCLRDEALDIIYADRGGDITFHGAGQVVAYTIFDLRNHAKDVRQFIRQLEKVISMSIKAYGIEPDRDSGHTGVWVKGEKVGFIGIGLSNWITYHGISLNANVDLRYFSMIRPCGIDGVNVTSLARILNRRVDIGLLKQSIVEHFCEVFNFEQCYYREDAPMALTTASAAGAK